MRDDVATLDPSGQRHCSSAGTLLTNSVGARMWLSPLHLARNHRGKRKLLLPLSTCSAQTSFHPNHGPFSTCYAGPQCSLSTERTIGSISGAPCWARGQSSGQLGLLVASSVASDDHQHPMFPSYPQQSHRHTLSFLVSPFKPET